MALIIYTYLLVTVWFCFVLLVLRIDPKPFALSYSYIPKLFFNFLILKHGFSK